VDLRKIAEGLGATAIRATTAVEVRDALADTATPAGRWSWWCRRCRMPTYRAGCLRDVAPAEVSGQEWVGGVRR
jgi:3D-(3,5/4)-trihydroxycyclohexane-1,2-dione acylhydrolase (decyclizing)